VAFFICWAPFHTQRLISIYSSPDDVQQRAAASKALQAVLFYSSGILYYVSSVINPILYNIMSLKFRRAFKTTLCRGGCGACCCRDADNSRVQATGGRAADRPRRPMAYRFNGDGHVQMLRIDSHERVGVGVHLRCPPGRGGTSPASAPAKFSDGSLSSGHGRPSRVAGHWSTATNERNATCLAVDVAHRGAQPRAVSCPRCLQGAALPMTTAQNSRPCPTDRPTQVDNVYELSPAPPSVADRTTV